MKPEMKKLIIANLPYLLFVYLFGKLGQAYRLAEGIDLSQKLLHFADGCAAAFESAAPSFHPTDLLIGVAGAAALRLMVYCKGKNAKKYRKGVEYGSARWGGPKDIAPYIDPNFDNNILLTQTERVTMNNRPKDPKTARNKNVLVIGGSGSGKTRFFVKPNLMQCVSKDYPTSFVITDPKGSLIGEVGQLLIRSSYRVKVLNTINFSKSMKYNPFRYAIEACCSLPAEQRTIHLQLRKQYRSLFYRLENPYSDTSRGIRIGEHHGYGLKNINRIVQENHGDFYTKKKDGVFTVQVRLNCEN
mgnify:CR=1 FL=1